MKTKHNLFTLAVCAVLISLLAACNLPAQTAGPSVVNGTQQPISSGKPDLAVGNYRIIYGKCPWEGPSTIRAWVDNLGTGKSEAFDVEINGERTRVDGLESGTGAYAEITFSHSPVGSVNIAADPQDAIAESSEDNNTYNIMFTPPPPCPTPDPNRTPVPTETLEPVSLLVAQIPANDPWFFLDEFINAGEQVEIRYVEGLWTYDPEIPPFDANGNPKQAICAFIQPGSQCSEPLVTARTGALVGSLNIPMFFFIGNETTFIAPTSGWLTLRMNYDGPESVWEKVSGEITVTVTITRP